LGILLPPRPPRAGNQASAFASPSVSPSVGGSSPPSSAATAARPSHERDGTHDDERFVLPLHIYDAMTGPPVAVLLRLFALALTNRA